MDRKHDGHGNVAGETMTTDLRELAAKLLAAIRLSRCTRCSGHGENNGDTCAICFGFGEAKQLPQTYTSDLERLLRAIAEPKEI